MTTIHCDYCDTEFTFDSTIPQLCPNCLSPLTTTETKEAAISLELVYQKNGAHIYLKISEDTVLGRGAEGKDILSAIPQISRSHCTITLDKEKLFVTDNNSTNGTYLGAAKIDCKRFPKQELKDGEILYLGREAFLIQLERDKENESFNGAVSVQFDTTTQKHEEPSPSTPTQYECQGCHDYVSDTPEFTCPKCRTYNG